jgi:uncharacterized protein (TIGR03663 family)
VRARELTPYALLAAATFAVRAVLLADRPLHHDESAHAWFAWLLATGRGYEYDPAFHGPVQFYGGVLGYALAGVGDLGVRLLPAVLGAAIVVLPYFLRGYLGSSGAFTAAVLLALSPSYVYYSRFAREDMYAAFVTLVLVVVAFRFIERPRPWHPALLLGCLALAFAAKETAYITVFVAGSFFLVAAARELRSGAATPLLGAVRAPGRDAWVWGACSFALVFTVLFTTFLTHPEGLRDGVYESLRYWLTQHEVARGGQPWFFYLVLLVAYELPIVVLGVWGAVTALRRPTLFGAFLAWAFVLSLVVYSWAGERMPWLVLHPLLPLVLLAALGARDLWARRSRTAIAVAAALGAAVLVHGALAVGYRHPADPAEPLVFTQTSTELASVRDRILALGDRDAVVHVDSWGGVAWPWAWYLRDLPVRFVDMSSPDYVPDADVVVVADVNRPRLTARLRGYDGTRFALREWWVVDYGAASPRDLLDWFLRRRSWSPQATLDEWLYVRRA